MTMSLVRGMTSLNTKKRKTSKMTASRLDKLQKDHREHNKHMKRIHAHTNVMTFDEYVEYVSGNFKPKTTTKAKEWKYELPIRETKEYPSVGNGVGVTQRLQSAYVVIINSSTPLVLPNTSSVYVTHLI